MKDGALEVTAHCPDFQIHFMEPDAFGFSRAETREYVTITTFITIGGFFGLPPIVIPITEEVLLSPKLLGIFNTSTFDNIVYTGTEGRDEFISEIDTAPAHMTGFGGDDILFSTAPFSTALGGEGDDLLGALGNSTAIGGPGNDELIAQDGLNVLDGGEGNDKLVSNDNRDDPGIDHLIGGPGNDRIRVEHGSFILEGGPGADEFEAFGNDADWRLFLDFNLAEGDSFDADDIPIHRDRTIYAGLDNSPANRDPISLSAPVPIADTVTAWVNDARDTLTFNGPFRGGPQIPDRWRACLRWNLGS